MIKSIHFVLESLVNPFFFRINLLDSIILLGYLRTFLLFGNLEVLLLIQSHLYSQIEVNFKLSSRYSQFVHQILQENISYTY